ncbi:MAG: 1-acyl-sn-glycerol-3-phosphate acyltransferase [Bacteroidota bacterium]
MLYPIVRPVARYVLSYYYRHIDLTGLEHIPPDGAVILAANHPTAFIEPCLLACFQDRSLHFLARGNLFKNTFYNTLLAAVNILPVFRIEDGGYGRLKDNYDTFASCHKVLSRGKAIMIMAEGRCIHEKALRPLRKGTARIALGALDADPTLREVYVVPVGANFTHADRVRSTVMIRCGEPIRASEFLDEYRAGEATAIKNFTRHLRQRLSPLIVQFPHQDVAGIGEARLAIERAKLPLQEGVTNDGRQLEKELLTAADTTPEATRTTRLLNRLDRQGVPLAALAGQYDGYANRTVADWLKCLIAGGLLLPQLPLWLLAEFLGASLPKHVEFYSPVRFAVVASGTFLLYPLALLLLWWPLKIWLLLALLSVNWSLRQLEAAGRWYQHRKVARMVPRERQYLRSLLKDSSVCFPSSI